ncbi:MAG: GTPase ObgE [Nitrospiraceae bacterium]|nr:GTPase ObgE [Nitrospiraceae bacterium]
MKFVDYAKLHLKSGDGGAGAVSFRREKYIPRGGPDGGDGGRGGHIIFRADAELGTLLDLKYKSSYIAERGENGMKKKMHGRDGRDLTIRVPVGTVLTDAATGERIADLDSDGKTAVAAKGGRGGQGNSHFATSVRQAPRYAQPGLPGEEREVTAELKLLADVGLIGLPNAGKSTLISVISSARPKIADYPFTTLEPVLGVVKYGDFRSFVVADIPGLIEGAHRGVGLGFRFLRHVERTKLLLHLVDVSVGAAGEPVGNLTKINRELALYSPGLEKKPQAVAATKTDSADPGRLSTLREHCEKKGLDFFALSAVTRAGLDDLLVYLAGKVGKQDR